MKRRRAMIRAIALPGGGEALAGRTAGDDVDPICAEKLGQIGRRKRREVTRQHMRQPRKIRPKSRDGFGIEIESREALGNPRAPFRARTHRSRKRDREKSRGGSLADSLNELREH